MRIFLLLVCISTSCLANRAYARDEVANSALLRGQTPASPGFQEQTSDIIPPNNEDLKLLGCTAACAERAKILLRERTQLNALLQKLAKKINATLKSPQVEANSHTHQVQADILSFMSRIWNVIAGSEVDAAVTQESSALDEAEFMKRLKYFMKYHVESGPNLLSPKGLIGGAVQNHKCASGAGLAGSQLANGRQGCMPVKGDMDMLPITCAQFGLVPNSVLKTLGDNDFIKECESQRDCKYYRFLDNGRPGSCLPHVREFENNFVDGQLIGGAVPNKNCASGFSRAGTAALSPDGKDICIAVGELSETPEEATVKIRKYVQMQSASLNDTEVDPGSCARTHRAKLLGIQELSILIQETKVLAAQQADNGSNRRSLRHALIKMINLKHSLEKEVTLCSTFFHNRKCDVLSPERRCGPTPWCGDKQVVVLDRIAAGTDEDCCSDYRCVAKGFSDGAEKLITPSPLPTNNQCPDFSGVSPLPSLKLQGISSDILDGYRTLCESIADCIYMKSSGICV